MFTKKDIEYRSIFLINCFEEKHLKLHVGELQLVDSNGKTLTKFPFQKILALFIVGHSSITTPLINKCRKFGVFISVMKMNLRPVFTFGNNAEANYLLREKQYKYNTDNIDIARKLIRLKITNQQQLLNNTRRKDEFTASALKVASGALSLIDEVESYKDLMGLEGWVSKSFFRAYFQDFSWAKRLPRAKIDPLNVLLDIGYTILFNFLESYARLFGFDVYIGVYHRLWYKRKSLLCDLIEPFRCIIDSIIRKRMNLNQFKLTDFKKNKSEYYLKHEVASEYYSLFMTDIIAYKKEIFTFFQGYYKYFMNEGRNVEFPKFCI